MPDLTIANAATLTGAGTASGDLFPLLDVSASAGSQGSKITRDELRIGMGITGGGTLATGGFTLTVPATGTAALRGAANTFTAAQTFNADVSLGASAGFTNLGGNSGAALWQRQDVGMVMFHGQGNNSVGIGSAGYLAGVTIGSAAVLGFSSGIPAAGHDLTVKRASAGTLQIDGGCIVVAGTRATAALTLSQTWNNAGVTCRGLELAVTNTNSASGSTLLRILGGAAGATQVFSVDNNGWINGPSGATMVLAPASGSNMNLYVTGGGNISCNAVIEAQGGISVVDARNITFATTTGTRIGTGATQKIGFWNATPVVQQVLATGGGATVDNVISFLQTIGLCKQS